MGDIALALTGWALTYLVHSTILLAAAWAVGRLLSERRSAVKETLWRVALLGGLLTATVQPATGIEPFTVLFQLRVVEMVGETAGPATVESARPASSEVGVVGLGGAGLAVRLSPMTAYGLLSGWALLSSLGLIGLVLRSRRLSRRLARVDLADEPTRLMVAGLCDAAGLERVPRLTVSGQLASPAVLGRSEICLPEAVLETMDGPGLRGILAHEVAHLRRRDPFWNRITASVVALLPFQPLNRIARRELRRLAELGCDDWARTVTGQPLALARALLEVAVRIGRGARGPAPALSLAASRIEGRIERLLAAPTPARSAATDRSMLLLAGAALMGTIWVMPGFAVGDTPRYQAELIPAAASADSRVSDAETPIEIRAVDPAGEFTVTLLRGRVVGASIEGVVVPRDRLVQTADSLRFIGSDGRALFSVSVRREGGISWEARPSDWRAAETEST